MVSINVINIFWKWGDLKTVFLSIFRAIIQMLNLIPVDNRNPLNQPVRENQMIAAIDIGTNSLHMVIVKIEAALPSFTMIAREK